MGNDVSGLILAGGLSQRFGLDKALAEVEGVPMITRVYNALAPLCSEILISVGSEPRTYELPGPARRITDRVPRAGPLGGLDAGLAEATTPWVLAVACDMPHLTTDVLRAVIEARRPSLDVVVGSTPDGRLQPLCACYLRTVLPTIQRQLVQKHYALHSLLSHLKLLTVHVPTEALRNMNSPEDLVLGSRPRD